MSESISRPDASKTPSQADNARVQRHMLDRLWNIFGEPKALDLNAFVNEYIKALQKFDQQQLSEGCDELFRTMKFTKWPTPSECITACNKAAADIYRRKNYKERPTVSAPTRHVKTFNILTVGDVQFGQWIVHFRDIGRPDLADAATLAGEIATHARWPSPGLEDFIAIGPFRMELPNNPDAMTDVFDGDGVQIR